MTGQQGARQHEDLEPLCALEDDTRRRLYEVVVAAAGPVSRDEASAQAGVDRSRAAYHLDRLVDDGLLAASFARPQGRAGPGAGRPAKYYQRADREFAVSLPPRDYELAAEVLVRAAEQDPTGTMQQLVHKTARQAGRELATGGEDANLVDLLVRHGFEPYDDDGVLRLRNCPFHRLARQHTDLTCTMNLALLSGLVEALSVPATARLAPGPDHCCVALEFEQAG